MFTNAQKLFYKTLAIVVLAIAGVSAAYAQQVGKVRLVIGVVQLESATSGSRPLKLGDSIFQGDQITTPATGYAVVTLVDNTKFTIKPNSVFRFNEVDQAGGKVLTELLEGGLKAITGTIGAQNPEGFKVDTPLGSIGIRGTRFGADLCKTGGDNCVIMHESLGCPFEPPEQVEDLLFVTVEKGIAYLNDCQDEPDILPGQVGITDGTASSCKVLDDAPCFLNEFEWQKEQVKDQTLKSLEAPVLPVDDFGSFCEGDPVCIQCEGDPNCIQCQGDPDCLQCQGDPLCIQCLGDPLCTQCQGDPICIQCEGDPECVRCQGDPVCIQCMGDPVCEVCQGDPVCINDMNNPDRPEPGRPNPMDPDPMDPCDPDDLMCICEITPDDPVCDTDPPDMCDGDPTCLCLNDSDCSDFYPTGCFIDDTVDTDCACNMFNYCPMMMPIP